MMHVSTTCRNWASQLNVRAFLMLFSVNLMPYGQSGMVLYSGSAMAGTAGVLRAHFTQSFVADAPELLHASVGTMSVVALPSLACGACARFIWRGVVACGLWSVRAG
eukprot:2682073-Rhodomonas_salina.1